MYKTLLVLILVVLFKVKRDAFLLYPTKDILSTPNEIGLDYIDTTVSDGILSVNIWWIPRGNKTFLVSHGNGGNMGNRIALLSFFDTFFPNHSILMYDYPMFGKSMSSTNKKSISECLTSSKLAWSYLTKQKGIHPRDVTLWGESLGCYISAKLATDVVCDRLILQSGFSRLRDMISDRVPYVGEYIKYLFWDDLDMVEELKKIKNRDIILLHSPKDWIVPYRQSILLRPFAIKWIDIEGGHNDTIFDETVANEIKSVGG